MKYSEKKCWLPRILPVLLFVFVCFQPLRTYAMYESAKPLPTLTGHYVQDLLAVARSQVGYYETGSNESVYGDWMGQNGRAWCSEFVSWCAFQAGIPESVIAPKASATGFMKFFSDQGRYYILQNGQDNNIETGCDCWEYASDVMTLADIRPGDILLVTTSSEDYLNGPNHTVLCTGVYGSLAYTIEGNIKPKNAAMVNGGTVEERDGVVISSWSASKIHGVCRPNYGATCTSTGHVWDTGVVEREATCSETGLMLYSCQNCKETKLEEIPKLAHTEVADPAVPATCTEEGRTAGSHCSVCGEVIVAQAAVPMIEHNWVETEVRREPTAVEEGLRKVYCTVCGASRLEAIPAKGAPAVGTVMTDKSGGAVYTVTLSGATGGTVEYTKPASRKLTSVSIPSSVKLDGITYRVTSIGSRAFYKCIRLTQVTIPSTVRQIGRQAFYNCTSLRNIVIRTRQLAKKRTGKNAFRGIPSSAVVRVPSGKVTSYRKLLRARGASKYVTVTK